MRNIRLHVRQSLAPGETVTLDEEASHYLGRVLRLPVGQTIALFSDGDAEFPSRIVAIERKCVRLDVLDRVVRATESPLALHLGLVLSKGDRMDYAVQKACELGVREITPLTSRFCEVRLDAERAEKRRQHLQKVAISASEQSERTRVARIAPIQSLEDWVIGQQASLRLVAHPGETSGLPEPGDGLTQPATIALLVGAEGGLHDDEVALARRQGFQTWSLGPRVLRTETAPIVALTWLQLRWGDLAVV